MDSLLKPFSSEKPSFGRHETFALRYAWLTKGFQAFSKDKDIFSSDEATIELGVGKNMVHAIKYWLRAACLIEDSSDGLRATQIATDIFSEQGYDPYLEDEATIWLIHWLLATNFESATAWYWFFNCFHKVEFTSEEAANALADFVKNNLGKHSERTVKQELPMILRMYSPAKAQIEDSLDAPLTSLKLITAVAGSHVYQSCSGTQANLPIEIIGYASNEIFNQRGVDVLSVNDLMYGGEKYGIALGSVFRLTESALLAKLEKLVVRYPNVFHINETAGIHQLSRLTDSQSLDFLSDYYQGVTL